MWNGICRTGPAWPPYTLQHPFPLQHAPDATLVFVSAKVSLSFKLSEYLPPISHAGVPLILFLLLLRFLVRSAIILLKYTVHRQIPLGAAHGPSSFQKNVLNVLCPLRYFIFLASKMTRSIQKNITILIFNFQGSIRPTFASLPKYSTILIYFGRLTTVTCR